MGEDDDSNPRQCTTFAYVDCDLLWLGDGRGHAPSALLLRTLASLRGVLGTLHSMPDLLRVDDLMLMYGGEVSPGSSGGVSTSLWCC